ncbi:MAG: hypothetical protein V4667_12805 [Bacteroidota bacterium]
MKIVLSAIAIASLSITLTSCGGSKEDHEGHEHAADSAAVATDTANSAINELAEFKFHTLLANIPSPLEQLNQLPKCGVNFKKELLNPTTNEKKYTSATKKAINYGVYGADLGYLSAFEQNQDIINYFTTTRKLAESLGAVDQFDKVAANRFEKNMNSKDSLMKIMDEAYSATEEYLKSNERLEAASLMLAGSWTESQYLLLESVKTTEKSDANKAVFEKVFEQRRHLESLIGLLTEYSKNADVKMILAELENVKKEYAEIKSAEITKVQMEKLAKAIATLRTKLIA